jgi:copper homeostasis protein
MTNSLEVAVFSMASALAAESQGAGRVEFNAPESYAAGGTTPPLDLFCSLSSQLSLPIRVMIRPRGPREDGTPDFLYSNDEFDIMKGCVQKFLESGKMNLARGDGFVFGILEQGANGTLRVDVERCSQLTKLAQPYPCVFHRAYDPIACSSEWSAGLSDLGAAGFRGLLTSGGVGNMRDNLSRLGEIAASSPPDFQLVAGGGLRAESFGSEISELVALYGSSLWLHTAALAKDASGRPTEDVDPIELKALLTKMRV